ncbi:CpsB/CapC family capsule biosynthesis tyrosine phosphatase [Ruminococcus sp.]|uniref:CpsB/CapC family capsule biosynthesis tyrosine phosphatase n=1 Tax=Ruminococcus sp. TaxID=41978 RepID=UPI0025EF6878|nr:CpsB/CapC family capsule biosynthesis tyrosine phosphatase [Ruminococcus sp.]
MLTDHHCHILPKIDDGSDSVETSLRMIRTMREQGVERIVATPHFYAHREHGVKAYLEKRQHAYDKLVQEDPENADIILGAEVAVEHGISKLPDIEKLCITGTKYILLEFQYTSFGKWMLEEVNDIAFEYGLVPILAHIHRYLEYYTKSELEEVLKTEAVFQFNNEAFESFKEKRFVKSVIKSGYPYIFGSDAHNMGSRKPNWDMLQKKAKPEILRNVEDIFG